MIFLIEYNRSKGSIVNIEEFKDFDRMKAEEKRLELEISLNQKKVNHEVVLLEAVDKSFLLHTHQRYFETLQTIAASTGTGASVIITQNKT